MEGRSDRCWPPVPCSILRKWEHHHIAQEPSDLTYVAVAHSNIDDVRPLLKQYEGKDVGATFAENQRRFAELQAQQAKEAKGLSAWFQKSKIKVCDVVCIPALLTQFFTKTDQQALDALAPK